MNWKTHRRASGLVEHVCECGVGHPNFGSALWIAESLGQDTEEPSYLVHGCCPRGCCSRADFPGTPVASLKFAHMLIRQQNKQLKGTKAPESPPASEVTTLERRIASTEAKLKDSRKILKQAKEWSNKTGDGDNVVVRLTVQSIEQRIRELESSLRPLLCQRAAVLLGSYATKEAD